MANGYASNVAAFIEADEDYLIGRLVDEVGASGVYTHEQAQILAWREEIRVLKNQLGSKEFQDWFIILEYEIPRRSRRPDVILLSPSTIFVIEFKVGARDWDSVSRWQANFYARNLRDFHEESEGRRIVPVLCATESPGRSPGTVELEVPETGVSQLIRTNGAELGSWLKYCHDLLPHRASRSINPKSWLHSSYRPTPTIVEAAVQLYQGNSVREISHHHAHNLDRTTEMLVKEVEEARAQGNHVICFVTGIPGAGKTLTGLDVVHDPSLRRSGSLAGIFLSGNGPLIKIVREALVKSQVSRGRTRKDCEHEVTTFIQNVHNFLRYHRENQRQLPHENVVVFDEAQRAWDREQMERKQQVSSSEASLLLGVMERLTDWAVIIALVGGGQEIFMGEAGLEEWGRALGERPIEWRVVAAKEALVGGESVAGHTLFENGIPSNITYREEQLAHLNVVVRNHRAQRWAEWVNELLALRLDNARSIFPDSEEFPCLVTRDLGNARAWLRKLRDLDQEHRIGLVATSKDHRLRAYGIERSGPFLMNYRFEKWFLESESDTRSSNSLEVAASEFECQGLELDWVGMCWGGDLTPSHDFSAWDYRKFRGSKWQSVKKEDEQAFTVNRYRVLLTRARNGLVIWVPEGDCDDPTRDPKRFDRVFTALKQAGVPSLEEYFDAESLQPEPSSSF